MAEAVESLGSHQRPRRPGRGSAKAARRRRRSTARPRLRHRQAQERHRPRLGQARQGQDHRSTAGTIGDYFARPVLRMMIAPAAAKPPSARPSSTSSAPSRVRASPARPARSVTASPAPSSISSRACARHAAARLPDARPARRRTQEVRQGEGPPQSSSSRSASPPTITRVRAGRFGKPKRPFCFCPDRECAHDPQGLHRRRSRHHRPADPRAAGRRARHRAGLHRPGSAARTPTRAPSC